ncbi:unnamed protein product [Peronospora destructor]|uniref:FYVE-type domain-containing protein n=1 Tax=Peronospora destructor TaxID=86335 RepID=A0AAV0TAS1_9STRA|nr:unnamed protein product [Peronospora destructor]
MHLRFPLPAGKARNLIDAQTWKLAKSKERLHCYRKRNTQASLGNAEVSGDDSINFSSRSRLSASDTRAQSCAGYESMDRLSVSNRSSNDGERSCKSMKPIVIGYGIVDGNVDDLVYGLYQSSTDEMKMLAAFLDDDSLIDCAVLNTIRQTRSSYLGLKWKLSRTVGGNRDCCYMDYIGVSKDANGQRFGYHVLESVVICNCPQFDDNSIVRTNVSLCFIFRPGRLSDQVEVFMEGAFDSSADVLTAGGVGDYRSTMDMLFNLPSAMVGAEAKKISAMVAIQSGALRGSSSKNQSGNHCSICRAKPSLLFSRTNCQTCGAVVCSKCRVRKVTFSHRGKIKVSCCKMCMVMVKDKSPFAGEQLEEQPAKPKKVFCEDSYSRYGSNSSNNIRLDGVNASVTTMSLTDSEYSLSSQSWQSSSLSSLHSDHDDSSNDPSAAMVPLDHKMPALMESEMPPRAPMAYQTEQQRMKQDANWSISSRRQPGTRDDLYNQMLELQMQAERAYKMTNQNASMMKSGQ